MLKRVYISLIVPFVLLTVAPFLWHQEPPPKWAATPLNLQRSTAYAQTTTPVETLLLAPSPVADARFGAAVDVQGAWAVAGAPGDDGAASGSGAAYLLASSDGVWSVGDKLIGDGSQSTDGVGTAVAMGDGIIAVGAPGDDELAANAGAVYVFRQTEAGWSQEAKLLPSEMGDTSFGFTVAADGNRIVVGAPYRNSGTTNSGAAYIFEHDGTTWQLITRLTSNSSGGAVLSDLYGWAVDIADNTVVVGAYLSDSFYLYEYDGAEWLEIDEFSGKGVVTNDRFGYSVATDSTSVVAGAPQDDIAGNNAGAAYVFGKVTVSDVVTLTEQAYLAPLVSFSGARMGWSVDVAGDTVAVGAAESKGLKDVEQSGGVYVYKFNGTSWVLQPQLNASDPAAFDHYGFAVAITPTTTFVGAPDRNSSSPEGTIANAGAVYVYHLSANPPPQEPPTDPPTDPEEPPTDPEEPPTDPEEPPTDPEEPPTDPEEPPTDPEEPPSDPEEPGSGQAGPPFSTDCMAMTPTDESTEQPLADITVTWDSSFHCIDPVSPGTFGLTLTLAYSGATGSAIQIDNVRLTHTTPRPLNQSPPATVTVATTLPVIVEAGASTQLVIGGGYELAPIGVGGRATLHLCIEGTALDRQEAFAVGANAHVHGFPSDDMDAVNATNSVNAPVLSNIRVVHGEGTARIEWLTDLPAFGKVVIGRDDDLEDGITVSTGCESTQSHSIEVDNLDPESVYSFQIVSEAPDGAVTVSAIYSFSLQQREGVSIYMPFAHP